MENLEQKPLILFINGHVLFRLDETSRGSERLDSNQRFFGYEPNEMATSLLRNKIISEQGISIGYYGFH